jgi:hypothetical protein
MRALLNAGLHVEEIPAEGELWTTLPAFQPISIFRATARVAYGGA